MTDELETFELLERIIITALADAVEEIGEQADLRTLMAVLARIAADAAVDYGLDEEQFTSSMRNTYQMVEVAKAHSEGDMQ